MLEINYEDNKVKKYDNANQFLGQQILEVPDFEDYTKINSVTLDGKKLELDEMTMIGLYNYLHDEKKKTSH